MECSGNEIHEHFSIYTDTFVEHKHEHDKRNSDFNHLHHHAPIDHHNFTLDELKNEERDTGRQLVDDDC